MAGGKLWGYVASGARALGGFAPFGRSGASAGVRLLKGVGGGGAGGGRPEPGARGVAFGGPAGMAEPGGPGRGGAGGMAGPQLLSRPELERLRWTDRAGGCVPDARHVQLAEVVGRVLRGGGRAPVVAVRIPLGLPVVVADATRLEAALAGLVDHAIRRNPPGARVLVTADPLPGPGAAGGRGGRAFPVAYPAEFGGEFGMDLGADLGADFGRDFGARFGARFGAGSGPAEAAAGEPARVELRVVDRGASELPEARQWLLSGVRGVEPGGPSMSAVVRAAGGRLAVEQTPGGGLTVVLVLTVARD
ncbi:hypothetical protein [Kitasatospora sp. NPDC093806]|uniref:hypothetical protein n=1 Tax=Kitasatospora sp. NPDC093806 TaxID=3155075 RepID=UPI0034329A2E